MDMNVDEHMGIQKGRMLEKREGISAETQMGETIFLPLQEFLEDGGFIQNFTDITEQKKHEQQVEKQKERYSKVLGDLNAIVFDSDLEKNIINYEVPELK